MDSQEEKEKILREIKEFTKAIEKQLEDTKEKAKKIRRIQIAGFVYMALVIANVILILVASIFGGQLVADLFTIALNIITVIFMTVLHEHNKQTLFHYPLILKLVTGASILINLTLAANNIMSFIK